MAAFIEILKHSIMITSFVFVMMLLIEYVNVITSGSWQEKLALHPWGQYFMAALLGAVPGCLGSFMVVTMYAHRVVSIGALVAAMVATTGDEAFLMLALIPRTTIPLIAALALLGMALGALTDFILRNYGTKQVMECDGLQVHAPVHCDCFPRRELLGEWRNCSLARGVLTIVLLLLFLSVATGQIPVEEWEGIKLTVLVTIALALFIVATVPDHFLEEHLWNHVARKHAPRVFAWTFGAFLVIHLLIDRLHLDSLVRESRPLVMTAAALVGLIPESGPHMIFVTMFSKGMVPFSILFVSAFVQDGHGMLPLLAHSRRDFVMIKLVKLAAGLSIGSLIYFLGY